MDRMEVDAFDQEINSVNEIASSLLSKFEQMKTERDLALAKCDELSENFEQMKTERDLALAKRDELSENCEQMKLERDLALAKSDELSENCEQMKTERDLALAKCDKAMNAVVWPSADIHFEDEHIGQGQEEEVIESWLAEDLPGRSVDYLNYDFTSVQSLREQRKAMRRWNNLTVLQKRIFNHYYLMCHESRAFEVDIESKLDFSWAVYLNIFVTLAKSIEEIVPSGCWIVREDAKRNDKNRPSVNTLNTSTINSARVVCFFKYNSQSLKGNHASHLCNNPDCINDKHIVPEPATSNDRRNECFKIGSSSTCQCIPQCLFVRSGHLLPCRNNPNLNECTCEEDCFREVIIERVRRARIQQNRQVVAPLFNVRPIEEAVFGTNRVGNRCLIINDLNYTEYEVHADYTRWRNCRIIDGSSISSYAYSDERVFFVSNGQ